MGKELKIPCAYQGGKQRISADIVDILLKDNKVDENTKFYDLCCGSGAISIELVKRGIKPYNITMLDASPWGLFWTKIGSMDFSISQFVDLVDRIPKDVSEIQSHIKKLSKQPANIDTEYVFLLLQASSFGSKAIWLNDNKWQNTSFRSYWLPTETSKRRSPVNPMMPMPNTLLDRVIEISFQMAGVNGVNCNIQDFIDFDENSVIYIDPPYQDTTSYGFSFDIEAYVSKINKKVYISEGHEMFDNGVLISGSRAKGGISGERKSKNEEWLNIYKGA